MKNDRKLMAQIHAAEVLRNPGGADIRLHTIPTDTILTSSDFWEKKNCKIFKKLLKTRKLDHV
jgi:hypothetical protein